MTNGKSSQSCGRIVVAGHSHVQALKAAALGGLYTRNDLDFLNIRELVQPIPQAGIPAGGWNCGGGKYIDVSSLRDHLSEVFSGARCVILIVQGNEHQAKGLVQTGQSLEAVNADLRDQAFAVVGRWLDLMLSCIPPGVPVATVHPPPPIESEKKIRDKPGAFSKAIEENGVRPAPERLHLWKTQCAVLDEIAAARQIPIISLPSETQTSEGFLDERFQGNDPIHANKDYGQFVLKKIMKSVESDGLFRKGDQMAHPYKNLPGTSYWRQSISSVPQDLVDPVVNPRFKISRHDAVATAGSCFAQHISKQLKKHRFNFMAVEDFQGDASPPYDFSARFGNVYTARQLMQLFDRAFGYYNPVADIWRGADGAFYDAFRPRIVSGGFPTKEALLSDRSRHLSAVRRMFKELDVFVFTLGLTECWSCNLDGAAYPLAPGVACGEFDPELYSFSNFTAQEVTSDLLQFMRKLKAVNSRARVIFTVSPVPLVATYEPRHVLTSTIYSKSVLRVAVEDVIRTCSNAEYFPSYEIIVGSHTKTSYFGEDRREVTAEGVGHVMGVFMRRMTSGFDEQTPQGSVPRNVDSTSLQHLADSACDEELLAQ